MHKNMTAHQVTPSLFSANNSGIDAAVPMEAEADESMRAGAPARAPPSNDEAARTANISDASTAAAAGHDDFRGVLNQHSAQYSPAQLGDNSQAPPHDGTTRARAEALTTAALYQHHVENDLDKALSLHRSALALYRTAAEANLLEEVNEQARGGGERQPPRPETYDVEIAIALTDIGDVHRCREEASQAMDSYRQALDIFRTICVSDGDGGGEGRGPSKVSANHPGVKAAERGVKLLGGRC